MKNYSVEKALLIAPVVGPLIYCIGAAILMVFSSSQGSVVAMLALVLSAGIPVSYIATLIIGLPIYNLLKKKEILTITSLTVSGALAGVIVLALFFSSFKEYGGFELNEFWNIAAIGTILGGAVAYTFARISGVKSASNRSDKDACG
ncbi:MAG: hypothetical protein N0C88_01995 [Candidatus Thiodiazotropha lotti]|uniref:Uncharacterized protein n=1 Tax=Candidatus Thiodiazotropha lotti TaxID=2792787 RepID=A0A9E4K1A5_9GAMM|nr:hypothetical protein [Candidatus Thiodiazotropha lotti]MCG8001830.1 hypothetical protein [Candidatus Thiodiazotropha lotti]MCW4185448.1 hypothetical protein [Candidatus Thiodiazotropha lotti]MCW4202081.1 hypothetical protein [Candidatus Thiodiazotropha lotti]